MVIGEANDGGKMGRLKLKIGRVSASSLVEVTIALVIISMVFTTATLIYLQAQKSVLTWQKLSASVCLENLYGRIQQDKKKLLSAEVIEINNLQIRKVIKTNSLIKCCR